MRFMIWPDWVTGEFVYFKEKIHSHSVWRLSQTATSSRETGVSRGKSGKCEAIPASGEGMCRKAAEMSTSGESQLLVAERFMVILAV
jgi:hypothetical protein